MKKSPKAQLAADAIPLLVADVYHLAGALRRWGGGIAGSVGQTQARWQLLSAASVGDLTVAKLGRRLGLARQSVQRTADLLVADGLAKYVGNLDHQRSPHLRLTTKGSKSLQILTKAASAYHLELAEGLAIEELQIARAVIKKLCMQMERDFAGE